jgi:hypothetical protein
VASGYCPFTVRHETGVARGRADDEAGTEVPTTDKRQKLMIETNLR